MINRYSFYKNIFTLFKSLLFIIGFFISMSILKSNDTPPSDDELIMKFDSLATYYCGKDLDSSIYFYQQLQAVFKRQKASEDYVDVYLEISTCAYNLKEIDTMYQYLQRFEQEALAYGYSTHDALFIQYYQSLGVYFYQKGDFGQAIEQTETALKIQNNLNLNDSTSSTEIYLNLGMMSIQNGDYSQAIEFFNYALQFAPIEWELTQYYGLAIAYNNLGLAYVNQKKYLQGRANYKKALDIYQHPLNLDNDVLKKSTPNVLGNLAQTYTELGAYDSAYIYIQQGLKNTYHDKWDLVNFNFLGYNYFKSKQYSKALPAFQKALNARINRYGWKQPRVTSTLNHIGNTYFEMQQYKTALAYYQKALTSSLLNFKDSIDVYKNPILSSILSERYVLSSLLGKAKTFKTLYHKSQDQKQLEAALQNYQLAIQLIEISRRGYKAEGSKQFLTESALPIFEQAIETAFLLYQKTQKNEYLNTAFQFAEQNKAVALLEALKDADAKTFANIPDTLLAKERELRLDLTHYEKKLYIAQRRKDSTTIALAEDFLFRIGEEYDYFIEDLEEQYPDYYQLKYNTQVATIEAVQQQLLTPEKGFIEYFVGDSSLYIFSITTETAQLYQLPRSIQFDAQIQDFRTLLTNAKAIQTNVQQSIQAYGNVAHTLYQTLLQPALSSTTPTNLMIVPDGGLGHLPFEALTQQPVESNDNFQTLAYLIHDYDIAYSYSATFLLDMVNRPTKRKAKKGYGGFAAVYEGDNIIKNDIVPLPNTPKEVETLATLTKGTAHIGISASERDFKQTAEQYQILHFSMHGFLEDKNPMFSYLMFTPTQDSIEDNQLSALEIYNLNLNADLAVLSACNTGFGTIRKGEGVMSLSRAFAYAGCPSLVMSLWSVPDHSTSEIMTGFYQNLIVKNTFKNQALRQAKLSYLDNTDALLAHPLFWAGFVPMGDMQPIELIEGFNWWFWGLGIGLFLIGFYRIRKKVYMWFF